MFQLKKVGGRLVAVVAGAGVLASNAMAASLTVAPLDTSDFVAVAGAVLVAGAVFWAIRKALKLLGV